MVRNLGDVLTLAAEVGAIGVGTHESQLHAFTEGKRVAVVEHVGLGQSGLAVVHLVNGNVGLGQPLSLDVNSLLGVSLVVELLAHEVGDDLGRLLVEGSSSGAGHSHSGGRLQEALRLALGLGGTEEVTVLSREVTTLVLAVMVGQEGTEAFAGTADSPVVEAGHVVHVGFVDHTDDELGLSHVHLGVLHELLVGGVDHAEAVVDDELLGDLLGLAVVGAEGSGDTSGVQGADVGLTFSQLSANREN